MMTEAESDSDTDGEYWTEQTYYQAICTSSSHSPIRRMQPRLKRSSAEIDRRTHKHTDSVEIVEYDVIGGVTPRVDERLSDSEIKALLTGGESDE